MKVHPSVVVGVGTSGAHVVSNIERIFYEVLGDTRLDLFRLLVIETDNVPRDGEIAPGGKQSQMVDAFENDIGVAIKNLTHFLGKDFDWCPKDLVLGGGRGAGNVRAGGRLMYHSKFPEIHKALQRCIHEAGEQVQRNATTVALQELFRSRGLEAPPGVLDPGHSVVYVVGTLAGGTCSGMCVDLGYTIRQIDQQAERVGIFFVPDSNSPDTFKQNAWAALKDLEYFTDCPDRFRAVWYSEQRTPMPYSRGTAKPYDRIYLVSSLNQSAQMRLQYKSSAESPLLTMVGNMLAADLLGLYSLRSGRLVNLNQHITGAEKHRTFLNFNLRGISYPKYEISEAAACRVVADTICGNWLDVKRYEGAGTSGSSILEDNERIKGRDLWNQKFERAWMGGAPSVEMDDLVKDLLEGMDNPAKKLRFEFTEAAHGTVFSKVAQTVPTLTDQIRSDVAAGLKDRANSTRNLRCMELFLEGVKGELDRTLRYWAAMGIPSRKNSPAWAAAVKPAIESLLEERRFLTTRALSARRQVIQDGLAEVQTRLAMHVLTEPLEAMAKWIAEDLMDSVQKLRRTMEEVQSLAADRSRLIVSRLREDRTGPVLRVSRSRTLGFDEEVERLAGEQKGAMDLPFLAIFDTYKGSDANRSNRIFLHLKNEMQPSLLQSLVKKGYVNIAEQLREQNQVELATIYLRQTLDMSLATHPTLQKSHTAVPSYIIAKDDLTAANLVSTIQQVQIPGLQEMETKSLPMFDHMVIFYQEGADFEPDRLDSAEAFRKTYNQRMEHRSDYLDPLGYMKKDDKAVGQ
ncbi:MAG: tubulin-like doman-containing protein [Bryobacteraceae bacterium]